jgi:hypothetical protein
MKTTTGLKALGILVFLATGSSMAGTEYRVGPGCAFSSIQEAVNVIPFQGSGVINVVAGSYEESVFIDSKNVHLTGGYADCTATEPTGLSTINATGTGLPVIRFRQLSGTAEPERELRLSNLFLINGTGTDAGTIPYPGGGLSVWTGIDRIATIYLDIVSVAFNESAFAGGGIALLGDGAGSLEISRSHIEQNQVAGTNPRGGGLYCEGDYAIKMIGGSIIRNVAGTDGGPFARGGGMYLDGCRFGWPTQGALSPDYGELGYNTAYGNGGGLFATGGAEVGLAGAHEDVVTSTRPMRIQNNRALAGAPSGKGGAIYATGADTRVVVDRGWIHDNRASRYGGAISVENFANVLVTRARSECHHPKNCSRIFNNHAENGGGAVFVWPDGEAEIIRTMVQDNTTGTSGPIDARGALAVRSGGFIQLVNSLMHGPVGDGFALAMDGGEAWLRYSTIADTESQAIFGYMGEPDLAIQASIIHETGTTDIANQTGPISLTMSVFALCLMTHEEGLSSLPGADINRAVVADPEFVDRAGGSFYLRSNSPAINFCDSDPPLPAVDLDWNQRGRCHSTDEACGDDVYDLGAYERAVGIFSDRFETP